MKLGSIALIDEQGVMPARLDGSTGCGGQRDVGLKRTSRPEGEAEVDVAVGVHEIKDGADIADASIIVAARTLRPQDLTLEGSCPIG